MSSTAAPCRPVTGYLNPQHRLTHRTLTMSASAAGAAYAAEARGSGDTLSGIRPGGDDRGMEVGEVWAYRARERDAPARVEVLRLGVKRPPRVLVRFLDDLDEGREEWVPPGRMKVLWDALEPWLAAERHWLAVLEESAAAVKTLEHRAADMVLDESPASEVADPMDSYRHAVLIVRDRSRFTAEVGFDAAELVAGSSSSYIRDDGTVVAAWPAMLTVARRLAERHADDLLARMAREDAKADEEAIHGQWYPGRGGAEGMSISPESCAAVDAEIGRPVRDLVRQWCGAPARDRFDELVALRAEVIRLGGLVEEAVTQLRRAGCDRPAADLERQLGVPLDVVRRSARRHHTT